MFYMLEFLQTERTDFFLISVTIDRGRNTMEKEIFEDGKEMDDFSVKNFFIQIIGCFLGLGVALGIHFGMNYLSK